MASAYVILKYENQTKIKGGCQSGRKVVPHDSKSDLPLMDMHFHFAKVHTYIYPITYSIEWKDVKKLQAGLEHKKKRFIVSNVNVLESLCILCDSGILSSINTIMGLIFSDLQFIELSEYARIDCLVFVLCSG